MCNGVCVPQLKSRFEKLVLSCKLFSTCTNTSIFSCSSAQQKTGFVSSANFFLVRGTVFQQSVVDLFRICPGGCDLCDNERTHRPRCKPRLGEIGMTAESGNFMSGSLVYSPRLLGSKVISSCRSLLSPPIVWTASKLFEMNAFFLCLHSSQNERNEI